MNQDQIQSTAKLAAAFGMMLMNSEARAQAKEKFDPRRARELAVIARILEKRLGEARSAILAFEPNHEPLTPVA
jgi:hypothetical protein